MFLRLSLCLVLLSTLVACSAVPDRYAPWRDNDAEQINGGRKPNLGDVPASPNVTDAKAQLNDMRQRLETERNNAYQAAQTTDPALDIPAQNSDDLPPPPPPGANNNLPPVSDAAPLSNITSTPLNAPLQQTAQPPTQTISGNVYYNYDPGAGNEYTYGFNVPYNSNVDVNPPIQLAAASNNVSSSDPSIDIDLSVLGGSPSPVRNSGTLASSGGITTGEPIAYFAHGSAKLAAKDRVAIRHLATQLKQQPQPVMLAGNASRRTGISNTTLSRQVNLKMSERRANAVMDELVKQGVSPEKIYVSAYGDAVPNRREEDGHSEAANRRVEILFDR